MSWSKDYLPGWAADDETTSGTGKLLPLDPDTKTKGKRGDGWSFSTRCYHGHKPLPIPGTGLVIHGGNCGTPVVTNADVYVGLCSSTHRQGRNALPWNDGYDFLYPITDMAAPRDAASFKTLIAWLADQLVAGKKVHVGCIGGHGRTGTVLAALVAHMTGTKDAIQYVRQHYCAKAVESREQVDFLKAHFGVAGAPPAKSGAGSSHSGSSKSPGRATPPVSKIRLYQPLANSPCRLFK